MKSEQANGRVIQYSSMIERYLPFVVEYGIYLYILLILFDKGEGLRNIGLFSSLAGWVVLSVYKKKIDMSFDIISSGFLIYLLYSFLSTFYSLDPYHSFLSLIKDVLKAAFLYLIVSAYFNNRMLQLLGKVICFSGLIYLSLGFYSFFFGDAHSYTSQNMMLYADKNKYGFSIGMFFPFLLMFFMQSTVKWEKVLWMAASVWAVLATVFSASRGAMGNVFAVSVIFALGFFKKKHIALTGMVALILLITAVISFKFLPASTKFAFESIPEHAATFNERTYLFWKPALQAVEKRPFLGWGYGQNIYRNPLPFEDVEQPDWGKKGGLHNMFIDILFHQGIVGLLLYLSLLGSTAFILITIIKNEQDERRLFAIALLSIIIGSFFVNSIFKTIPFSSVALILAISSALFKNRQDEKTYHETTDK